MSTLTAEHVETAMQEMYGAVEVSTEFVPRDEVGGIGELVVTVEIPRGCHIQAHDPGDPFLIPFQLEFEDGAPVGSFEYPAPEDVTLSWSPKVLRVYHDVVRIAVPVTRAGETVRGKVSYQACTETMCLWPAKQAFEVRLGA